MSILNTRKPLQHEEEGFTLMELVIVVAIIGILTAIGVPNIAWFMGFAKVEGLHANNHQQIKNFQAAFILEGGGNDFSDYSQLGSHQGIASRVAAELNAKWAAENKEEGRQSFVFTYSSNGLDLNVCSASLVDQDQTPPAPQEGEDPQRPGVARTDCLSENVLKAGPNWGMESYK